jgi:hypothetical protein
MRNFPTREALVAAYWRKLTGSNGATHKSRGRVFARHTARRLQTHQPHASHSESATDLLRPRA